MLLESIFRLIGEAIDELCVSILAALGLLGLDRMLLESIFRLIGEAALVLADELGLAFDCRKKLEDAPGALEKLHLIIQKCDDVTELVHQIDHDIWVPLTHIRPQAGIVNPEEAEA